MSDEIDDLSADYMTIGIEPVAWPYSEPPEPVPTPAPADAWLSTLEASERLGVGRRVLEALSRAHPDVPGGPVQVAGHRRRHLRCPADGLNEWLREVQARSAPSRPAPASKLARRSSKSTPPASDRPTDWGAVRRRLLGKGK